MSDFEVESDYQCPPPMDYPKNGRYVFPKRLADLWHKKIGCIEQKKTKFYSFSFRKIKLGAGIPQNIMLSAIKYVFDSGTAEQLLEMLCRRNLHVHSTEEGRRNFAFECVQIYREHFPQVFVRNSTVSSFDPAPVQRNRNPRRSAGGHGGKCNM